VHHDLTVSLDPAGHRLKVHDRISIPGVFTRRPTIVLNSDLTVQTVAGGLKLIPLALPPYLDLATASLPVREYAIDGVTPGQDVTGDIEYEGVINYPVRESGGDYARSFAESPGLIEARGVYLAGATHWVPEVFIGSRDGGRNALVTYALTVTMPAGWKSVSQGISIGSSAAAVSGDNSGGTSSEFWLVTTPAEEVHLIAAPFIEYSRELSDYSGGNSGGVTAYAFLRKPEPALAARYLDATAQYLAMYEGLLGPYPYPKFALVENFWETGYGMPSFTLLGEKIILFPFILHSSYPHELLHNWWGNGVFVDMAGGNWSEGLTAYLADHLIAEQRGQGAAHRRAILQRVTDYVTRDSDFPPSRFVSRHDGVTEAIGYGKTAMVWNMLRDKVGDDQFIAALQAFYRDNRFRAASYGDIEKIFEAVTGRDLKPFFDQWINRTGAPELRLDNAESHGNRLDITLSQVQVGRVFALDVPVVIATEKGVETRTVTMPEDSARVDASFDLEAPPLRVEIDPQFQLYRRLAPFEVPPSLSKAFGAGKVLIVTHAEDDAAVYAGLVKAWIRDGVETVMDTDIDVLPADRAVWVLGAGNRFAAVVADALKGYGASLDAAAAPYPPAIIFGGSRPKTEEEARETATQTAASIAARRSLVAAVRHPNNPALAVVFVSARSEAAANALARKLPHYGKYSWLVFTGDDATNEGTGEWPAGDTPLARNLVPDAKPIKLAERKPLAEIKPAFDILRMKADVEWLAAPEREGRGPGSTGLEDAAGYIEGRFESLGLTPLTPGARIVDRYSQRFTVMGENGQPQQVRNIIGVVPGVNPAYQGQAVIVSAHYDHLGFGWPDAHDGDKGQLHPGADDNASGVAVLLELARLMVNAKPERSIIFAAFSGEEEGLAGSRTFVQAAQQRGARFPLSGIIADINLDTVGRLGGGKVTVFGAGSARELPFIFTGAGAATGIQVQAAPDIGGSDDHAFVEAGVPAVQLYASTAEDYHRPADTAGKIDYAGLGKVTAIVKEAVDDLAARAEPLEFTGTAAAPSSSSGREPGPTGRRATTGIVPDMTDQGEGVRVASVQPGSGAEAAGIRPGDRLLALGGIRTSNIRALAEALKALPPGHTVDVEFARDAATLHAQLRLGKRQ
jgi:hypothetical protein